MEDPNTVLVKAIKQEATTVLADVAGTLKGLQLELATAQRRQFDSSDFMIDEFRRVCKSIDGLVDALGKLP